MTKEEFDSQVELADTVKLRYFKVRSRANIIEETCKRIRPIGGVTPNILIYHMHKFMEANEIFTVAFGKDELKYSDAYNIYRDGKIKADYVAKTGRLI